MDKGMENKDYLLVYSLGATQMSNSNTNNASMKTVV